MMPFDFCLAMQVQKAYDIRRSQTCSFTTVVLVYVWPVAHLTHLQAICGMVLQTVSLGMCLLSSLFHLANHYAFKQYAKFDLHLH